MLQDPMIRKRFRGVYPLDLIPNDLRIPSIIVVNHDKSGKKGSHWIVLHFKENNIVEHFDSTGKKPIRYIHNLLISKNMMYIYNKKGYRITTLKLVDYFVYFTVFIRVDI